ncbi:hypothetical protein N7495_004810 [Penicillium taxi]|uniref:uncharacterized protein n=1 Tax=Penicillium taxi TaxID=168475 RepID=UPI0025451AF9|nr:uncharacterized protein N7495_004810 [Penicillium taxi]KAJ5900066.1 hypothetical protein N7495_004810 [Penicillium taxi]
MSHPIKDLSYAMDQWLAGQTTPPGPPWSPITPPMAPLDPVAVDGDSLLPPPLVAIPAPPLSAVTAAQIYQPQPTPVPISESENPDAIALRSALSILQMQKQQALRDIQRLDRLKEAASVDPEGFARELAAGHLTAESNSGSVIQFTDEGEKGFGRIPPPQNVIRMPPINWAKYQIVGESLDRLHDEQLRRPSSGEPYTSDVLLAAPVRLDGVKTT